MLAFGAQQAEYEKACVVVLLSWLLFIHLLLVYYCVYMCVLSTLIHNYVRLERCEIKNRGRASRPNTHGKRK